MIKLMSTLAALFLLAYVSASADSQAVIGKVTGTQTAILTYDMNLLRQAFEQEWDEDGTTITSIYLELYDQWYLVAEGSNNGNYRLMGVPLNPDQNGNLRFAEGGIKQKCTGNPCSKCRFTRDITGAPDGCTCGAGGSHCDHTIEIGNTNNAYLGNNIY